MLHQLKTGLSTKSLLGKIIRFPFKLLPKRTVLRVISGLNRNYKWIVGSGVHSYWLGTYENYMQNAIAECYERGMVAYDLGAHAGFYTLIFSRLSGNDGWVYAFEPNYKNLLYLRTHIDINRLNNITILPIALGKHTGYTFFDDKNVDSSEGHPTVMQTDLVIPIDTIDNLVRNKVIKPPDLIKIDVEGCEQDVIKGSGEVIRKYKPIIFIAIDDHANIDSIYNFLAGEGYRIEPFENFPDKIKAIAPKQQR